MEIFLYSRSNAMLGLANRLVNEGHTVLSYVTSNAFTKPVRHPFEAIKSCKFIIAESDVPTQVWDWAKTFNKPIIGFHPMLEGMNNDCYKEWQVAKKLGIPLPKTDALDDVGDMYEKVLDWNSTRTLIRYDRDTISCDYQQWMAWAIQKLPLGKKILLQQPEWGEELTVTGWFDGLRWMRPFVLRTSNDERMKGSSSIALFKRDWTAKIIEPFAAFLRNLEYKGPFTVRANVTKDAITLTRTHAGFDALSFYAFLEGLKEPAGEFLHRVAFGLCETADLTTDYFSAVNVATSIVDATDVPIIGLDEGNQKHIFLSSVRKSSDDLVVGSDSSSVFTITAHGRDLSETFGRIYHTASVVKIPDPIYTTNLAPMHDQSFAKLRSLGYL